MLMELTNYLTPEGFTMQQGIFDKTRALGLSTLLQQKPTAVETSNTTEETYHGSCDLMHGFCVSDGLKKQFLQL